MKIANRKSKGAQFEYSIMDSLKPKYSDIKVTKQLGFVSQYDLITDDYKICIECKCHKGFSWNELEKYFLKLKEKTPEGYQSVLVFKYNRQPCLAMYQLPFTDHLAIKTFEQAFDCKFIKHTGKK